VAICAYTAMVRVYLINNHHILNDDSSALSDHKLVCVNGMMRTGSSALTRGLAALGVDLGAQIQKSEAIVNPTGFWEDAEIYDTLHSVYRAIGFGDHMSTSAQNIPASRWERPQVRAIAQKLAGYVQRTLSHSESRIVAAKNPSIGRLMPFWLRMVELAKCEDWYILTIRAPAAVVKSCRRAWNFPDELSHALWVQFTAGAIQAAAVGRPTIAIDYDRFMADPSASLFRIARWLKISPAPDIRTAVEAFSTGFIRRDLQHFVGSSSATVPPLLQQLYTALHNASLSGIALNSEEFQSQWQSFAPDIAAFTRNLDALDKARQKIFAKRLYWRGRSALKDTLARAKARAAGRVK